MPEPSTNSYRDAIKLSNMAVFEWDIREDSLHYDDMLPKLLLRELPRQGIRSFLENPRLIHPKERTDFKERVNFLLHGPMRRKAPYQDFNMDFRIHTTGRCYLWIHMAYRVHYEDGAALRVTGFLQNVNLIHQEKNRMQNLMERDPMTGLYSKTHSAYLVEQTVSSPEGSHALLVIDMDNFKQVNDKLGHLIGDAVILDVALNLKRLFRQADILGHIGGDEFPPGTSCRKSAASCANCSGRAIRRAVKRFLFPPASESRLPRRTVQTTKRFSPMRTRLFTKAKNGAGTVMSSTIQASRITAKKKKPPRNKTRRNIRNLFPIPWNTSSIR